MKVIALPRRGGKTTQMLQWLQDAPQGEERVCMTFSHAEADRLFWQASKADMGLTRRQFVSPDSDLSGAKVTIGIDNLDLWLSYYFGQPVAVATLTVDEPATIQPPAG